MTRAVTHTPTPNPNAMRFSLGESALSASHSYASADAAASTPWARRLFEIPGVSSLFAVNDFVTVTKDVHAGWEAIIPHVVEVLQSATLE